MDAQALVTDEVREVIRRGGLDPVRDPGAARQLVESTVTEYDNRAMRSPLPPVGDRDALVKQVLDTVVGFGPLQPYLDARDVEEIWINEPG
ncbi:MAG: hypothetical protein ACFCVF_06695 [Kineosporiaceae bacterium]